MLTRCPHCQTAFRVTPEQLKVRQGQVRCGTCRGVFNALDSLADEVFNISVMPGAPTEPLEAARIDEVAGPTETAAPPAAELDAVAESRRWQDGAATGDDATFAALEGGVAVAPEADAAGEQEAVQEPAPETEADAEPETAQEAVPEAEPEPEPELEQEAGAALAAEAEPEREAERPVETTPASPLPAVAEALDEEAWVEVAPPPVPRRWPWLIGALPLLALAIGQLLYIYRVELAVLAPELRPALAAGCELIGCKLLHPRKPELLGIEVSDLAPANGDRLLLSATLKNRAPFAQEYPHLELTLTDTRDAALLRKVLPPADYLPAERDPAAGFAARGEMAVKLNLEAAGVPAVGYRLYLFYP